MLRLKMGRADESILWELFMATIGSISFAIMSILLSASSAEPLYSLFGVSPTREPRAERIQPYLCIFALVSGAILLVLFFRL